MNILKTDAEKPLVYEKPQIERVNLALEETLATGCKLGTDSACMGPPVTAFSAGS